jgi:hypothetical protein
MRQHGGDGGRTTGEDAELEFSSEDASDAPTSAPGVEDPATLEREGGALVPDGDVALGEGVWRPQRVQASQVGRQDLPRKLPPRDRRGQKNVLANHHRIQRQFGHFVTEFQCHFQGYFQHHSQQNFEGFRSIETKKIPMMMNKI